MGFTDGGGPSRAAWLWQVLAMTSVYRTPRKKQDVQDYPTNLAFILLQQSRHLSELNNEKEKIDVGTTFQNS